MGRSSAGGGWSSGGALLLWAGIVVIELFTVLVVAGGADADSLAFGQTGTTVVVLVLMVFAIVSAVFAWRGVSGPRSVVLAGGQFVGAALVLVMTIGFFLGDGTTASSVAPLLVLAVFAEAMIGVGVLHSARRSASSVSGG
jgi:hypothetical protein